MLISCPHCRKQLQIPDDAAGKQLRCPLCQGVFQAPPLPVATAVQSAPPPVPPPPPAPPRAPAPAPPHHAPSTPLAPREAHAAPASTPASEFAFTREPAAHGPAAHASADYGPRNEFGFEPAQDGMDQVRCRASLASGAGWMTTGAVMTLVTGAFGIITGAIVSGSAPLPSQAIGFFIMLQLVIVAIFYGVPAVFVFIGASHMRRARSRGLVITGVVFLFIMMGIMLLAVLGILIQFATMRGIHFVQPFQLLLAAATAGITLTAAIKALNVLGRPEVREEFARNSPYYHAPQYDAPTDWERRRY